MEYIARIGIALSVLLNVVTGGASNQTFSARNYIWKMHGEKNAVLVIDLIFFWQPDHCRNSWLYWVIIKYRADTPRHKYDEK